MRPYQLDEEEVKVERKKTQLRMSDKFSNPPQTEWLNLCFSLLVHLLISFDFDEIAPTFQITILSTKIKFSRNKE